MYICIYVYLYICISSNIQSTTHTRSLLFPYHGNLLLPSYTLGFIHRRLLQPRHPSVECPPGDLRLPSLVMKSFIYIYTSSTATFSPVYIHLRLHLLLKYLHLHLHLHLHLRPSTYIFSSLHTSAPISSADVPTSASASSSFVYSLQSSMLSNPINAPGREKWGRKKYNLQAEDPTIGCCRVPSMVD